MRNGGQKGGTDGDVGTLVPRPGRGNNGIIPNSFKALSRIVSSGASTVASTVRSAASAASAMVDRDNDSNNDQYKVLWAGFDKLELEGGVQRQVLLLGYSHGFQVWDVQVADNVHNLVSRHDGPVSFMQMQPKPVASKQSGDNFADSHPLLIICADGSFSGSNDTHESGLPSNGSIQQHQGSLDGSYVPTVVWFYSLRSQSYVHLLRFRSVVHLVRCSSRVVAVLQSSQIHCFDAASLEREYTIVTNPVPTGYYGSGNVGFGPLAVGPRWMAYSGSQVATSNSGRVNPQHLTPSASFPYPASNGNLVAHYAKESSKQLAAGIVTLGDMGYKKLARYYSELLPEGNNCQSGTDRVKVHYVANGHPPDADSVGMVIVRDIVSKSVIAQFRAHKSPILSLCFDPSGTLLVTASVQGHNINVFRIMPGGSSGAASGPAYVHLYRLQRGVTNAVIQDISFSSDSQWVMISSSRGTSHLFAISPSGGLVSFQSNDACVSARNSGSSLMAKPAIRGPPHSSVQVLTQQNICASGPPVTLSAISKIRNGHNGWRNTVSGAAAAATGRMSSLSGVIASAFHNYKGNDKCADNSSLRKNYSLLVFSPSGCVMQYALHIAPGFSSPTAVPGISATCESGLESDARLLVEPIQKWNICQKQNRKEREYNFDMHGENGNSDSSKVYPEKMEENNLFSDVSGTTTKENISTEEKNHKYISEAELQMHENRNPLWARPEIYFQTILNAGSDMGNEGACGGETEIERFPVHMLEARSKDLVPVFDYLQAPKFQHGRTSIINGDHSGQLEYQGSDVYENGRVTRRSSSGSLDSLVNGGTVLNEHDNGTKETSQDGLWLPAETSNRGFVNTNDSPIENTHLENVNNTRENSMGVTRLRSVHNSQGLNMDNQFAENDEFG